MIAEGSIGVLSMAQVVLGQEDGIPKVPGTQRRQHLETLGSSQQRAGQ